MIKFVYCVRRRSDMSPEQFRKYWIENHGPLVRSLAGALRARRYIQSHTLNHPLNDVVRSVRQAAPPYDGITEIWWDSLEDLLAAQQTPEAQAANRQLAEDEARFVDLAQSAVFFTEEHTIFE